MTNSTSTDVIFGGARCNRMITKQYAYHSTTPADKQINEQRYSQPPPPLLILKNRKVVIAAEKPTSHNHHTTKLLRPTFSVYA